ncbi:SDR family oxidoreductase [Streptacidiphilus sp. PAMC 29251]
MILITAANGNQGRLLVPRLLAAGQALRACVRSEASAESLRAAGVADVVVGDLADSEVMARAMDGMEKVYYVGPTLHPREREMGFAAVDAARAAGVQHFVFSSVLHAILTDLTQHEIKRDVEEHLLSSGLEFTILQPRTTCCATGSDRRSSRASSCSRGHSTGTSRWSTWAT